MTIYSHNFGLVEFMILFSVKLQNFERKTKDDEKLKTES